MVDFNKRLVLGPGVSVSPDGGRILTASTDKIAKLWDAASGELIVSFDHQGYQ
jgi:hypothetical protein